MLCIFLLIWFRFAKCLSFVGSAHKTFTHERENWGRKIASWIYSCPLNGMNAESCIQMQNSWRTSENGPLYFRSNVRSRNWAFGIRICIDVYEKGALDDAHLQQIIYAEHVIFPWHCSACTFVESEHRIQCPRKIIMDFSVNFNAVKTFKQRHKNVSPKCSSTNSKMENVCISHDTEREKESETKSTWK